MTWGQQVDLMLAEVIRVLLKLVPPRVTDVKGVCGRDDVLVSCMLGAYAVQS